MTGNYRLIAKNEIAEAVQELLFKFGPDGHNDGHEEITAFIIELLKGKRVEDALKIAVK